MFRSKDGGKTWQKVLYRNPTPAPSTYRWITTIRASPSPRFGRPGGATTKSVKRAVLASYRRCGWMRTGVHILRHSMASRLLRTGAPMKEIADILRHRSLDTSAIYAKVDLTNLGALALPWPGSAR
ncbi:tyrosine-type recombinase/integrase [Mesorhizobium sp.]|uniref:tyrosine-type recombinase/integrase n=1 Tax=Mesorhizobium sp. TaxID=1871066 RepID=UPI00257EEA12|nr:tyrosine-type recombinase/integrase [Mesorhizobium sp.]